MATLADFLQGVLVDGCIHIQSPPSDERDPGALPVLQSAYDTYLLSIAGPRLPFQEDTALAAARLLERAAWYLLHPNLPIESPEKLALPAPTTLAQHLSADLTLCFVPTLHRRAAALMQEDALPTALERVLREWPLSGVLADIVEPPLTPIDFGDHVGLNFLYAERLLERERPGWFPRGRAMEYVELVWQQQGKSTAMLAMQVERDERP